LSLIVAIVEIVRFCFGWITAGRGSPGLHDDGPISAELDLLNREMCGLGGTKDATDNTLMVQNFAFRHGSPTPLKTRERAETL
jgi:hypothetical protein